MFLQGFAKAEMWSIRRQVVREHVLFFPQQPLFLHLDAGMEPGVVENHDGQLRCLLFGLSVEKKEWCDYHGPSYPLPA